MELRRCFKLFTNPLVLFWTIFLIYFILLLTHMLISELNKPDTQELLRNLDHLTSGCTDKDAIEKIGRVYTPAEWLKCMRHTVRAKNPGGPPRLSSKIIWYYRWKDIGEYIRRACQVLQVIIGVLVLYILWPNILLAWYKLSGKLPETPPEVNQTRSSIELNGTQNSQSAAKIIDV